MNTQKSRAMNIRQRNITHRKLIVTQTKKSESEFDGEEFTFNAHARDKSHPYAPGAQVEHNKVM